MRIRAIAAFATSFLLTACTGGGVITGRPTTGAPIAASALDRLLLGADDINSIMGGTTMTGTRTRTDMVDHANLMTNINCLGIWQVGEQRCSAASGTELGLAKEARGGGPRFRADGRRVGLPDPRPGRWRRSAPNRVHRPRPR
jgi:hypothetical protein